MHRLIAAAALAAGLATAAFAQNAGCPVGGDTGGAAGSSMSTSTGTAGGSTGGVISSTTTTTTTTEGGVQPSTGTAGGATGGAVETSTGTVGGGAAAGGETGGAAGGAAAGAAMGAGAGPTGGAEGGTLKDRKWKIALEGGYSTFNMKEVNDDNDARTGPLGSATKIESGYDAALELLYKWDKRFDIGLRGEYLVPNEGKLTVLGTTFKENLSAMPVLIGGRYALKEMGDQTDIKTAKFDDRWGLNLGAFVGYNWAWGELKDGTALKYSGSDFAGDVLLGWDYRISRDWTLGLDVGYRYAPVSKMKYSDDYPLAGIRKDDTVTDQNGGDLKYDFSGLIANIALGLKF